MVFLSAGWLFSQGLSRASDSFEHLAHTSSRYGFQGQCASLYGAVGREMEGGSGKSP